MTQIPLTFHVSKMTVTLSPEMLTWKETNFFFENRKNETSFHLFLLLHRIFCKYVAVFRTDTYQITNALPHVVSQRPWTQSVLEDGRLTMSLKQSFMDDGILTLSLTQSFMNDGMMAHSPSPWQKESRRMAYSPCPWTQSVREDGILTVGSPSGIFSPNRDDFSQKFLKV